MSLTLENQVCSFELAKKLKEVGITQSSLFYWFKVPKLSFPHIVYIEHQEHLDDLLNDLQGYEIYSAFTDSELDQFLAYKIFPLNAGAASSELFLKYYKDKRLQYAGYQNIDNGGWSPLTAATKSADAKASLLLNTFIENNHS